MFLRNNVKSVSRYMPSIASAGSVIAGIFYAPSACEVTGAHLITGAGTLTSGWSLNIYKNASNTGSRIATTGATAAVTAYTGSDVTLTGTSALKKLAAGDIVVLEWVIADADTTIGTKIQLDYVYGYVD